ncbi:MAG: FHA domain-containing protein [Deltaproteobacteria bacterium]|nr:FHA domain-containing protein [Deltaproteobacteria bacterium]
MGVGRNGVGNGSNITARLAAARARLMRTPNPPPQAQALVQRAERVAAKQVGPLGRLIGRAQDHYRTAAAGLLDRFDALVQPRAERARVGLFRERAADLGAEPVAGRTALLPGDAPPSAGRPAASDRMAALKQRVTATGHGLIIDLDGWEGRVEFVLGRNSDTLAPINSGRVSRQHARVTWVPTAREVTITDLGSSNGVYVGGRRITGSHSLTVPSDQDRVEFNLADVSDFRVVLQLPRGAQARTVASFPAARPQSAAAVAAMPTLSAAEVQMTVANAVSAGPNRLTVTARAGGRFDIRIMPDAESAPRRRGQIHVLLPTTVTVPELNAIFARLDWPALFAEGVPSVQVAIDWVTPDMYQNVLGGMTIGGDAAGRARMAREGMISIMSGSGKTAIKQWRVDQHGVDGTFTVADLTNAHGMVPTVNCVVPWESGRRAAEQVQILQRRLAAHLSGYEEVEAMELYGRLFDSTSRR